MTPDTLNIASPSAALATAVLDLPQQERIGGSPRVSGRFLVVDGRRFWIKGVTYGTFRANEEGEPFPAKAQVRDDFARMRDAGINTVRLYSPPPTWLADCAADAGLYLFPDMCWGARRCDFDQPERIRSALDWTRGHA